MASLPSKPLDHPSTQREERRHPIEDKDSQPARPMASQSRYRERPLSSNDRVYVPRTRSSEYDSYVTPVSDRRREDDIWRRDHVDRERDRGRGVWERTGDIRDRERGSRFGEPGPEHDRDRRAYTRERGHDRDRTHYSPHDRHRDSYDRRDHRPSSPVRPDASYRRSSRSPTRRRPISPPPPHRTKPTSRPHSRSPPAKRMRLERPSGLASPRSRSPLRKAHELPSTPRASESRAMQTQVEHNDSSTRLLSRSPQETQENSSSNITVDGLVNRGLLTSLSQSDHSTEISHPTQSPVGSQSLQQEQKNYTSTVLSASFDTQEATHKTDIIQVEPKRDEKDSESDMKMVDRSLSPPKHPRFRDAQPSNIMQHHRESRSPPRGPRNHSRNMAVPAAPSSFLPAGLPRGPRRQHAPPTSLVSQDPAPIISPEEPPRPAVGPDLKFTLPPLPVHKPRPSLTPELDTEIARLQTHRAHLASEYVQISKGTRRALHELDTATLDLRAAESRRKVADSQMEKARAGVLGIDANLTASMA